jgi:hypothetical protein
LTNLISLSTNSILSVNNLNATSKTTFNNLISLSTFSTLSIKNLNALATAIYNKTNFTNLYVSGAPTVLSSLNVSGNTTINNATTINPSLNVVGNVNIDNYLSIAGRSVYNNLSNSSGFDHGTLTDFNNITDFDYRFINSPATNGPGTPSNPVNQYYSLCIGLGSSYGFNVFSAPS